MIAPLPDSTLSPQDLYVPAGKDITEFYRQGGDVYDWLARELDRFASARF
jgi:hypothetical protein